MIRATLNQPVPLQFLSPDGATNLFAQAKLYDLTGTLTTTVAPLHVAGGLYSVNWTPGVEGYFTAVYQFFTDSGFTAPASYDKGGELIEVSSDKTNIARLLGLVHENTVLDQQTYNDSNRLVSARLRAYDTKVNAVAAGSTGLLFSWSILAAYDGTNRPTLFELVRET